MANHWPYELRIKFTGPPPDHGFMTYLRRLVTTANGLVNPTLKHDARQMVMNALLTGETTKELATSTMTLEIPDTAYTRVKPIRRG